MLRSSLLHSTPHFAVNTVVCAEDHPGWSAPETSGDVRIVLVRRGTFVLRSAGARVTVDRRTGYLELPGQERRFAHPAGGDVCTSITVAPSLWEELSDGRGLPPAVPVDGRLDLEHRLLLRTAGDGFAGLERLLSLVARTLRGRRPSPGGGPGRRALARLARDAVLADHPDSHDLRGLARLLGVSPSHLSRTFLHHTGVSLSRFRTRVRVERALDRIEDGESDLAALAADLGFADQAHLTRVMRAETGRPPAAVRRLLDPSH
ncbi:helix-turn-helix domain-containing protein [Halostreptopolyspora alba]|uniref:AraC family transcriptional regulator n=1 Tax=Halostreptopolyspora alba TaxID=2487137 RepID=A0A3N0EIA0_9ACTN|nr:AraC family transcriptional regulator [Nocardiopsaceae bacterium YIM 96095]